MSYLRLMAAALPAVLLAFATAPAGAAPTADQQKAIRSACPGDFRANCSGVSPGGAEALQCLEKNMSVLTPACQAAVKAVAAPAAAPAAPAAAPAAASEPAAAPAPAASNPPPATKSATATPSANPAPAPAKTAPPPAPVAKNPPPAPAVALNPVPPPMTPKQEARFVRQSCRQDYRKFCRMEPLSGGKAVACLRANAAALDPVCKYALMTLQK